MTQSNLPMLDLLLSLSEITDLINPAVANHHKRVGYITFRLAVELGFTPHQVQDAVIAAILHDIGAFSLSEKLRLLDFECGQTQNHSEAGFRLLSTFTPINDAARIVRHHHDWWVSNKHETSETPPESRALFLADRIAVLINPKKDILNQVSHIRGVIAKQSGKMFDPACVEAFQRLAIQEDFWLDIIYQPLEKTLDVSLHAETIPLTPKNCSELAELFRKTIDFRSHFTATHSSGVAATASEIAKIAGLSGDEIEMMHLAGYLHDLGKIAVPAEILEKGSQLNRQETFVMRAHTYHTDRLLSPMQAFDTIRIWAALHHERLDGKGYPFHVTAKDLPLGSRIMAVADIFVALCENRPYRRGLSKEETMSILKRMADNNAIDRQIVELVEIKFNQVNEMRILAQQSAAKEFGAFTFSDN